MRAAIALIFAATSCGLSPRGIPSSAVPSLAAKQQRGLPDLCGFVDADCDRVSAQPWWKEEEPVEGRKTEWNGCMGLMQAPGLSDCKSLHPAPASVPCNVCGNVMVRKGSRFGYFYGCSAYMRRGRRCYFTREARVRSFRMYTRPVSIKLRLVAEMEDVSTFRLYLSSMETLPQSLFPPLLQRLNVTFLHADRRADGEGGAVFALAQYRHLLSRAAREGAVVAGIPRLTLQYFSGLALAAAPGGRVPSSADSKEQETLERLPEDLRNTLCPYQVQGVRFALERGGRCLIADEMGLGKTLQAIALAAHYQDWPVLIVTPASMRLTWVEECERWLPFLRPKDVHVIFFSTDKPSAETPKVTVVSFQMLHRLRSDLMARRFGLLIIDESHTLRLSRGKHDRDAAHTQTALKFIAKISKVILLSGTPSPTKPLDMYHQISSLRPEVFGADKFRFAADYCQKRRSSFLESGSCKRPHELHLLLSHSLMIRRLKKDVLTELPPKRRSLVPIMINPDRLKLANRTSTSGNTSTNLSWPAADHFQTLNGSAAAERFNEQRQQPLSMQNFSQTFSLSTLVRGLVESLNSKTSLFSAHNVSVINATEDGSSDPPLCGPGGAHSDDEVDGDDSGRTGSECGDEEMHARTVYELVGRAKVQGAGEWLSAALEGFEGKMALFAHHRSVMAGIQRRLEACGVQYVKVDGTTDQQDRHSRLKRFKQDPEVRVALVSVTAGGQGVDLSAATVGVFAELPPDVSWCRQAEDRLHRRGQQSKVNIYYLVAHALSFKKGQSSFVNYDRVRWQRLNEDLRDVTGVTDGPASAISLDVDGCQDVFRAGSRFLVRDKTPVLHSNVTVADDADERSEVRSEGTAERSIDRRLFFEVSLYTNRIHLYRRVGVGAVTLGSSERAFGEEFELLGSVVRESFNGGYTSLRSLPHDLRVSQDPLGAAREIQEFLKEWESLSPYQQRRLRGFHVQCPLKDALMQLPSPTRKLSKQRYMDVGIAESLPAGASVHIFNVTIPVVSGVNQNQQSPATYVLKEQGVDLEGNRLCVWCQKRVMPSAQSSFNGQPIGLNLSARTGDVHGSVRHNDGSLSAEIEAASHKLSSHVWNMSHVVEGKLGVLGVLGAQEAARELGFVVRGEIEYHELFCSGECMKEYAVRVGSGGIRRHLKSTDRGVCDECGLDCRSLCERLQSLSEDKREGAALELAPALGAHRKLLQRLVLAPKEGNAWHADHVAPVYEGGGGCGLDNIRTLCVACHAAVTRRQAGERAAKRRMDKGLSGAKSTRPRALRRNRLVKGGENASARQLAGIGSMNATRARRKQVKSGGPDAPHGVNATHKKGRRGIRAAPKMTGNKTLIKSAKLAKAASFQLANGSTHGSPVAKTRLVQQKGRQRKASVRRPSKRGAASVASSVKGLCLKRTQSKSQRLKKAEGSEASCMDSNLAADATGIRRKHDQRARPQEVAASDGGRSRSAREPKAGQQLFKKPGHKSVTAGSGARARKEAPRNKHSGLLGADGTRARSARKPLVRENHAPGCVRKGRRAAGEQWEET